MSLDEFDFSEVEQMMADIFGTGHMGFQEMIENLMTGDFEFTMENFLEWIGNQFFYELQASRSGLIHILLIVIVATVFTNFSNMFQNKQVAEISFSMLYMLLISICLQNFKILVEGVTTNIGNLSRFMEVLSPLYFMAVAFATGSVTSVSFYQIVLLFIYFIELLILNFLIPVTQIYLIIKILSEFSPEIELTKFAELIELIVSWVLKSLTAGIIGLNVMQRLLSPVIDSVKRGILKGGGESIPIIGDAIGGTAEVVVGTAVLIKNAIGVAGMVVCLVICLAPVIQMGIHVLMYYVVSAMIQPVSDKRMVNCVGSMAEGTKMLLKILLSTGVLFLVTVAVAATTSGGI